MGRRLFALCFCCIALSPLADAQVQLEFGSQAATYRRVLLLRNGSRLLVGSMPRSGRAYFTDMVLTLLGDSSHSEPPSFGGGGSTVPTDAALDPEGGIWIAGWTDSDDFKLVKPIISAKVPYQETGFVAKLDPTGHTLLFSTFLGGAATPQAYSPIRGTEVTALAIDNAGSVYVGGETGDTDFPTLGGFNGCHVFLAATGDSASCSFVAKITPAATLVYSTTVTTGGGCTGSDSGCIGHIQMSATTHSVAVDGNSAVTMSGSLGSTYNSRSGATSPGGEYICRIAPDGSRLLWTLYASGGVLLAPDASGNVRLFGRSVPVSGAPSLYTALVNADGSGFTDYKVLGQSADAHVIGIRPDKQGNLYLAGTSASSDFPLATSGVPNLGTDFVLKVDQSGSPVQPALRLPHGAINAPPVFNSDGHLMLLGVGGAVLNVPNDYHGIGPPAIVAIANSASLALNTGVSPGALLTLFGFDLPSAESGFRVTVDGIPAPILFAGPNQINLQVPFNTSMPYYGTIPITVSAGKLSAPSVNVSPRRSIGLFTSDGVHASALNQDGTVNSQSNPASGGSVVTLFGTGARWPSGMKDGAVPQAPGMLDPDLNRFEALLWNQTPIAILYAGTAPGIINGVFQVNVLLPPSASNPPPTYGIVLNSLTGELSSNVVQVYFR